MMGPVWQTREEARAVLFEYIEVWYNRERLRSSIDYLSPADYEAKCTMQLLLHDVAAQTPCLSNRVSSNVLAAGELNLPKKADAVTYVSP